MALSLLLADDSPTIAKILSMALASEDYTVRSVLTAKEAEQELQNTPFFFLVDLTLPEKDGYSFARQVKQNSKTENIRVILLASAFEPVDEQKLQNCAADAVIVKPFEPAELRKKLRELQEQPVKKLGATAENDSPPAFIDNSLAAFGIQADLPPSPAPGASSPAQNSDADAILSTLLQAPSPSAESHGDTPPPFSAPASEAAKVTSPEELAGLSANAQELAAFFAEEVDAKQAVSALANLAPLDTSDTSPNTSSQTATTASPVEASPGLSANAQALAEFFSAEVDKKQVPPASLAPVKASEAPSPAPSSLSAWSSTPVRTSDSPFFDTGGSSFRFSEDYVQRITQAFSGAIDEHVPLGNPLQKEPVIKQQAVFPTQSSDQSPRPSTPLSAAPVSSSPLLSASEQEQVEKMIREEVQLVCREIVEKVAWEIIPELAENLIRKELERVLKDMEN